MVVYRISIVFMGFVCVNLGFPTSLLDDLQLSEDTQSVGSYIREVRAAAPPNFEYQNEGDGEIGFSRKKGGGGKKGYQHFDSYHKKAGDNYEFEKQDSYGLEDEGKGGADGHEHEESHDDDHSSAYSHKDEQRVRPEYQNSARYTEERESEEHEPRSQKQKDVEDESREERSDEDTDRDDLPAELREGASDGNGGTESHGHHKADYVLPEKYTYGEGEEYDFK